jgi:uncharacterized damage-inducible protein DinB
VGRYSESVREHRRRFEAFCRSLSDEELERPVPNSVWTVKDFISHLTTLDIELARWIEGIVAGRSNEPARTPDGRPFDIDVWNNAAVAERRGLALEQVLEEAADNRERFETALQLLEDEHLEGVVQFSGDNKRGLAQVPLKLFLSGLCRHDPIHVADMLKALPERAGDPELRAWLDDPAVKWYQEVMSGPPRR